MSRNAPDSIGREKSSGLKEGGGIMAQVSVIVPTFNKREQVREALQSVLEQDFQDIEIVIADDGSTDGTPLTLFKELGAQPEAIDVLAKMGNNSIRPFTHAFQIGEVTVQYHYGINRGLSTARNRGIKSARGEYIAFLEPDDIWATSHLSELCAHLERHPEVKVCRVSE
jgi:glycosyltransferase involved in cell wall biosynthesis